MKIKIKKFNNDIDIKKIDKGDWIDLRCVGAEGVYVDSKVSTGILDIPILKREVMKLPKKIERGRFVDSVGNLEEADFIRYSKGEFLLLDLGVAMELPEDYEAYVVPRGSTFKTYGFIETNSIGVIDEIYKGDNDRWFMPVYCMRDGFIVLGERVCQFRINKKMPKIEFNEVKHLGNIDRGGHGSTGNK